MLLNDRFNLGSEREFTDEGFLNVPAKISRVGIQEYKAFEMGLTDREPNDIIRVFRPEEEVFSNTALKSFSNKPVTDNHPPEAVNAKNFKTFTIGHSGPEVTKDGIFVKTMLHIMDADTIAKIESGKVELSNGYSADIEWTSGVTPEGEQFDAIQRNIIGNHIAIVDSGRAGSECSLADNLPLTKDTTNMKITIDGVDFDVSDQAAQAVGKLQKRLKDTEHKNEELEEDIEKEKDQAEEEKKKAEKTEDSLNAKIDDAKSKIPTADQLTKLVSDRANLIGKIKSINPDIDIANKTDDDLRKEVVSSEYPELQMDSVSSDYITARFDILVENINDNSQHRLDATFSKIVNTDNKDNKTEDNRTASVIAREKMVEDSQNAWKGSK